RRITLEPLLHGADNHPTIHPPPPSRKTRRYPFDTTQLLPCPSSPRQVDSGAMNARRQAVRDQVLRTAADLFRERGYRATTLDDIVARLGMSKASLYTYFHAKEEMLAAISRQTIVTFTRELSLVLRSDLAPEDKLRRVVRDHVRFVIANRSFLTVFFSEEANLPPRLARALAAQKDRYDKGVESIVVEGV